MSTPTSDPTRGLAFVLVLLAACGGGPSLQDGMGTGSAAVSTTPTAGAGSCGGAEGCPCTIEGESVSCRGPTLRDASGYVTCPAGTRACSGGQWGPCVSAYAPLPGGSFSESFPSGCAETAAPRWSSLTLLEQLPAGARAVVGLRTADTESLLDASPLASLATLAGAASQRAESFDVQAALEGHGLAPRAWLRVEVEIQPAPGAAGESSVVVLQAKSECGVP